MTKTSMFSFTLTQWRLRAALLAAVTVAGLLIATTTLGASPAYACGQSKLACYESDGVDWSAADIPDAGQSPDAGSTSSNGWWFSLSWDVIWQTPTVRVQGRAGYGTPPNDSPDGGTP